MTLKPIPLSKESQSLGKTIVLVVVFFALGFLLKENMGYNNEIHFLPLAKQYGNPTWIPGDFYYNSPPSYRLLFLQFFAPLTILFGFLATSIIGRLIGYTFVATAIVLLAQKLELKRPSLFLALTLFLYVNPKQSMIAQEWLIGSIESKVFAYGFLLISLLLLSERKYGLLCLCLGLTNSFHLLVGGWGSLILGLSLVHTPHGVNLLERSFLEKLKLGCLYLLGSLYAIYPLTIEVYRQFSYYFLPRFLPQNGAVADVLSVDNTPIPASFLYTFLRTPHHINPQSWPIATWLIPLVYLSILIAIHRISSSQAQETQETQEQKEKDTFAAELRRFAFYSTVPIGLGLLAIPFDRQGIFLQYYPFRVGAIMVPLITCLFLSQWLEQQSDHHLGKRLGKQVTIVLMSIVLGGVMLVKGHGFWQDLKALKDFPVQAKIASPEWVEMCFWIRDSLPSDRVVLSSPATGDNFTWLSEHPSVVKFRLVPAASQSITEWYYRLQDLSGGVNFLPEIKRDRDNRKIISRLLDDGFNQLDANQINALKDKYDANYLLTPRDRVLPFPILHANGEYQLFLLDLSLSETLDGRMDAPERSQSARRIPQFRK